MASIATFHGGDAAALRTQSVSKDGAQVFVQEDTCTDTEANHGAEVVSYVSLADTKQPISGTVVGGCTWEFADYSTTWIDAKLMGTAQRPLQDDDSISMQLPFLFPFYGERKDKVKIASNGYMTFGAEHFPYGNTRKIPRSNTPNELVAPYWADWNPPGSGTIYTYSEARIFVVQWDSMAHCCRDAYNAQPSTFETILLDDGTIKFVYQAVGSANPNTYAKTSIGIENHDGSTGVQVRIPLLTRQCFSLAEGLLLPVSVLCYIDLVFHAHSRRCLSMMHRSQDRTPQLSFPRPVLSGNVKRLERMAIY